MSIFNHIFVWYLFLLAVSLLAVIARICGNEWLRALTIGIFVIFVNQFWSNLAYLQSVPNLWISLVVFLVFAGLFYVGIQKFVKKP